MPDSTSPALAPHISSEFDERLTRAHGLVVQMGARARRQLDDAIECLRTGDAGLADQILRHEVAINALELSIDVLVEQIIARRQPAASDLRLLTTLFKATTDLERIGDEAKKIALRARTAGPPEHVELAGMAKLARELVHQALLAIEQLDAGSVAEAAVREESLDAALRGVLRGLISHMIEDPRTISGCLDLLFVAKSLERAGDHATNVLEHVVYATRGDHLRHAPPFSV